MSSNLTVIDLFAGAGGMSTGIIQAAEGQGYTLGEDFELHAINHDECAIATHEKNHPRANHYHAKVEQLHPPNVAEPGEVDILAGGPSCVPQSKANAGDSTKEQLRASPWHVLRWVEYLQPTHLIIENVEGFRNWGYRDANGDLVRDGSTFEQWIRMLENFGYTIIHDEKGRAGVKLRAADYGDPTTRKRLFVLGSRTHRPTRPRKTHSDEDDALPDWRPASEIIDWSNRGTSLFGRSTPLSGKTLSRIAAGIRDYCDERLHAYADILEDLDQDDVRALQAESVDAEDLPAALDERDSPFLVEGEAAVDETASTSLIMGQHGGAMPRDADTELVPTVTTSGAIHHIDVDTFILPRNGPARDEHSNPGYDPDDRPVHTITAKNHDGRVVSPFLVQYNGQPEHSAHSVADPLPTLTTRARYALVHPDLSPWGLDLRYRMLDPPETKLAQGFPEDYEIVGDRKKDLRRQIGNAVPVGMAKAIAGHVLTAETPSLSNYGGGLSEQDVEVPSWDQVATDGGVADDD